MDLDLTDQPKEVIPGMRAWRNTNGFLGVLLHFTADPDSANEAARRSGMIKEDYEREHNLSFETYAGKPVYGEFSVGVNVDENVLFNPALPIWRGWDFGYHRPACLWVQPHTGVSVLGEVLGEDMTLERFIDTVVLPYQERVFPNHTKFLDAADPAGKQVSDKSEHTSFSILANRGIFPYAKKTEISEGITLVRQRLPDGRLKVHPRCKILIDGFKGGYRYPEATKGTPNPQFPLKDGFYDHLHDTLRYIMVNVATVYQPKQKPKVEKTREELIYEKLRKGRKHMDPDLGEWG